MKTDFFTKKIINCGLCFGIFLCTITTVLGAETAKGNSKMQVQIDAKSDITSYHFTKNGKKYTRLILKDGTKIDIINEGESIENYKKCISNVKQIGLAILMYSLDHNEKLPKNLEELRNEEYLVDSSCYVCPADSMPGRCSYIYDPSPKSKFRVRCNCHGHKIVVLNAKLELQLLKKK